MCSNLEKQHIKEALLLSLSLSDNPGYFIANESPYFRSMNYLSRETIHSRYFESSKPLMFKLRIGDGSMGFKSRVPGSRLVSIYTTQFEMQQQASFAGTRNRENNLIMDSAVRNISFSSHKAKPCLWAPK